MEHYKLTLYTAQKTIINTGLLTSLATAPRKANIVQTNKLQPLRKLICKKIVQQTNSHVVTIVSRYNDRIL